MTNLRASGERIETLLDELQAGADPRTYDRAQELLRSVCDLYGAGLTRILELAAEHAPDLTDVLVDDDLVVSLLLVHGLHPVPLIERVQGALTTVRPLLGAHGGDVELLSIDADRGRVRLRLLGSCDGCPSSAVTLQGAVERAIVEAAPEVSAIEVDQPAPAVPPVSVAISSKPAFRDCPSEVAAR